MKVTLVDHMGSDLSVVNAARVSFAKTSDWDSIPDVGEVKGYLKVDDERLIKYLAKHDHWSPFGHASMQFHIKAPVFVARQLVKHQVGLVWNDEPEFYTPKEWRLRPEKSIKQGSSEETIEYQLGSTLEFIKTSYQNMLKLGIAPEMARMILPQSMYTEWYWSGTLMAFARVCNLRCKPDAQKETQMVADQIDNLARDLFPNSWEALREL